MKKIALVFALSSISFFEEMWLPGCICFSPFATASLSSSTVLFDGVSSVVMVARLEPMVHDFITHGHV